MTRVMLNGKKLPVKLRAESIHAACYILNRVTLRIGTKQTPYEILKGRKTFTTFVSLKVSAMC